MRGARIQVALPRFEPQPAKDPELIALAAPVPPDAAMLFGYPGEARFVGFYWEPSGDEVFYDDGRRSGTGESFTFLAYLRYPAVSIHLDAYNLGYSDEEAEHCLVDQEIGRASIATRKDARAFLADQHPPPPQLSPYEEQEVQRLLGETLRRGFRRIRVSPEEIERRMEERAQRIAEMLSYLECFSR